MISHQNLQAQLNGSKKTMLIKSLDEEFHIRKANEQDAEQIANVLSDFYNMEDTNESLNAFHSEFEKGYHYIVAEKNREIIGLVTWLSHGLLKHGLFELDRICLLRQSRGLGIGRKLIKVLINDAKDYYRRRNESIRKLYLLTHEENKSAQLFYEKVGFEHETTLIDHYYKNKNEKVYSIFFK